MSNIWLSIIVPVYNVEKYIDQCIQSLVRNYREGIEIILVDDGSTDSSSEICDKYSNEYYFIKVFHKENGGLSSARNRGIKESVGKYLWFIDSDDYIGDRIVERVYDSIQNNVDIIVGNYQCFYPNGETEDAIDFYEYDKKYIHFYELLLSKGLISYMAVRFIVKRDIIVNNNLLFKEGIYHEDEEWTPRVAINVESYDIIQEKIYYYRVGLSNSIMGMLNEKKIYDKIKIGKEFYEFITKNSLDEGIKQFINYKIEHVFIAGLNELSLYPKEKRKDIIKEIKDSLYIIEPIKSKKTNMVLRCIKLIGVNNTSKLLNLRLKLK